MWNIGRGLNIQISPRKDAPHVQSQPADWLRGELSAVFLLYVKYTTGANAGNYTGALARTMYTWERLV